MVRFSCRERDYTFGQMMLTLRTTTGLTQRRLAESLGISQRAVAEWEAGSSYPSSGHLKHYIELGVQKQAFPSGREEEGIRALWKAAHQKVFLDEYWLSALLHQQRGLLPLTESMRVEKAENHGKSVSQALAKPRLNWGDALATPLFYGREQELALLEQWVMQEHCRVVSVVGIGGIGKSSLTIHFMYQAAEHFEAAFFHSLRDAPSCEDLLQECLESLSPQPLIEVSTSLEQRIRLLLECLRERRTLLVLDNLETLLEEGDMGGHYRPGYEEYGRLVRRIAETTHQSCLLLTSREKLPELQPLEGVHTPVRLLRLTGLDPLACEEIFKNKNLVGTSRERVHLSEAYAGNPLALRIVAESIADLFTGKIGQFLADGEVIFGSIQELLAEQFARLSPLEQTVLCWLAIVREPVTIDELLTVLATPLPRMQILEAIASLRRRSLVECSKRQASFTLQSVVLEYVSTTLIVQVAKEIQENQLDHLIAYGLEQATAKEYVRQTQQRLLVTPLLVSLRNAYQRRGEVEERLGSLLDLLRKRAVYAQGYGAANLMALLREQRGHLRGLDLSHLSIRGAYLRGVEMQDTLLVGTNFRDTIFTEAFDAIWSVAISNSGWYWVAGSRQGEIRVWGEGGQTLNLIWQAHTDSICALACSPDGQHLASGSWDGTVKLWNLQDGMLLWTGWHTDMVRCLAFAPDGHTLVSGGGDEAIQFWDVTTGQKIRTLSGEGGTIFSVAWSPDGTQLASGSFDGNIRVWQMRGGRSFHIARVLTGHTHWVTGVAFAPDSTRLASASWDGTVRLWNVASGSSYQTLTGHTDRVRTLAWSPDGRTIASAGFDETIWLWDEEKSQPRAVLRGHTTVIYSIAFTPDSHRVLSGSEDGTLRLWDIERGRCVRVLQGYAVPLYDVAWSPEGTRLATAGADTCVNMWTLADEMQPKVLHGHRWTVQGVTWSPDGQLLASSGWDNAIRLWDSATGSHFQALEDTDYRDTIFQNVSWSPDGQLLASGSYLRGVQVWDARTYTRRWIGTTNPTMIRCVMWHPDSKQLVSCGEDGRICVWEATGGTLQQVLLGHSGMATNVAWSPDGTRLASSGGSGNGGELLVWDVSSGTCQRIFSGQIGMIFAVAWSLDGKILISGESNGTLRWWEVQSGTCVVEREGHQGTVQALRVSPDGSKLASCGNDSSLKIWNMESGKLLRTLRRDRPYERLNISRTRGLTLAQKTTLGMLGAIEEHF